MDTVYPFNDVSQVTVAWLLPCADRPANAALSPPVLRLADYHRVRGLIGTPSGLDEEVAGLPLAEGDPLPPASASLLMNAITTFALLREVFGDRASALRWWTTPITLSLRWRCTYPA